MTLINPVMAADHPLAFTKEPVEELTPTVERDAVLAAPVFGRAFTDHMVTIAYDDGRGWHDARLGPLRPHSLHPATAVLHYAQEVFEGLKAHRRPDGSVVLFRAEAHAGRFNRSLRRMSMPELPEAVFVEALHRLVAADLDWVPSAPGTSLYLRPYAFATDTALGAGHPSHTYLFTVIASPSGNYFGARTDPISVWISEHFVRAAAGGTGEAKAGANYAGALLGLQEAAEHGCDQAIWLDAHDRQWIEEAGAMNLFFVLGSGDDARLLTPPLTGTYLPGITRDSILRLAPELGLAVVEEPLAVDRWRELCASGEMTEAFACGTASVIVPIGTVRSASGDWTVGDGSEGPLVRRLREELVGIHRGTRPDRFGWTTTVGSA